MSQPQEQVPAGGTGSEEEGLMVLDAFRVRLCVSPALTDAQASAMLDQLDGRDFRKLSELALTAVLNRYRALGGIVVDVER